MLFLFEPDDDNVTLGCDFDCHPQVNCGCYGVKTTCGCNDKSVSCACQGHAYCAYAPNY